MIGAKRSRKQARQLVRELENAVERAAVLAKGTRLEAGEVPAAAPVSVPAKSGAARPTPGTLEEVERSHILSVLEQTQWAIEGERGAARVLGLNPSTLRGRLRKLGLRRRPP